MFGFLSRTPSHEDLMQLLSEELRRPESEASKRVQEKASILAGAWVMSWLDKKGLRHCAVCPSQETLRKFGDQYFCPTHYKTTVAAYV